MAAEGGQITSVPWGAVKSRLRPRPLINVSTWKSPKSFFDSGKLAIFAKRFRDAHEEEEDPNQTEEGRQMDIYNNSKGYDIGEYARNQGYALEWIEQEVLYSLDNGLLMVIKE